MKYLLPLILGAMLAVADIIPSYQIGDTTEFSGKKITLDNGKELSFYSNMIAKLVDPVLGTSYSTWSIENGALIVDQQIPAAGGLLTSLAAAVHIDTALAVGTQMHYFANGEREDAEVQTVTALTGDSVPDHNVTYQEVANTVISGIGPDSVTTTYNYDRDMTLIATDDNGSEVGYGTWSLENGVVMVTITQNVPGVGNVTQVGTLMFDGPVTTVGTGVIGTYAVDDGTGQALSLPYTVTAVVDNGFAAQPVHVLTVDELAGKQIVTVEDNETCALSLYSNMTTTEMCNDGTGASFAYGSWSVEEGYLRLDGTANDDGFPIIESTSVMFDDVPADGVKTWTKYTTNEDNIPGGQAEIVTFLSTVSSATASDFSQNGYADLLWHQDSTGAVKVMEMNDMISESNTSVVATSNTNLLPRGIGDFTGDGKPDILFHNQSSGNLRIWEMDGTVRVNNILVLGSSNTNLVIAGVGDFDLDGDNDIAVFNTNSGALRMWVMDGTTRVDNVSVLTGANLNLVPRGAGDMDGDSIPDLVLRNNNSGAVRVWTMNSDFTRKGNEFVTSSSNTNLELRGVVDINSDGNNDILNYNTNTGMLRAWLMDGNLTKTDNVTIVQDADLSWSVRN